MKRNIDHDNSPNLYLIQFGELAFLLLDVIFVVDEILHVELVLPLKLSS